jgi:hypothetical protein
LSFAPLWRDQGKRAEPLDLLGLISHRCNEGCDAPLLQVAKALLDELVEWKLAQTSRPA